MLGGGPTLLQLFRAEDGNTNIGAQIAGALRSTRFRKG